MVMPLAITARRLRYSGRVADGPGCARPLGVQHRPIHERKTALIGGSTDSTFPDHPTIAIV